MHFGCLYSDGQVTGPSAGISTISSGAVTVVFINLLEKLRIEMQHATLAFSCFGFLRGFLLESQIPIGTASFPELPCYGNPAFKVRSNLSPLPPIGRSALPDLLPPITKDPHRRPNAGEVRFLKKARIFTRETDQTDLSPGAAPVIDLSMPMRRNFEPPRGRTRPRAARRYLFAAPLVFKGALYNLKTVLLP